MATLVSSSLVTVVAIPTIATGVAMYDSNRLPAGLVSVVSGSCAFKVGR
jgi:hypothetical protein